MSIKELVKCRIRRLEKQIRDAPTIGQANELNACVQELEWVSERIEESADAAAQQESAPQEQNHDNAVHCKRCGREIPDGIGTVCAGACIGWQESAPTAEQERRQRNDRMLTEAATNCAEHLEQDGLLTHSDTPSAATQIRTYMRTACQAYLRTPSPAQENPVEASVELEERLQAANNLIRNYQAAWNELAQLLGVKCWPIQQPRFCTEAVQALLATASPSEDTKREEPRAKTLLRSMIHALDTSDSDTYWMCLGMLNVIHREMIDAAMSSPSVTPEEKK